ncbi:MAG TPA: ABC transporter substrate-binding protein [Pseudonocardiaceae bacterium]|nr:ABC transporter substrate-binding protein [Pseudonocardiaceae bacterium]
MSSHRSRTRLLTAAILAVVALALPACGAGGATTGASTGQTGQLTMIISAQPASLDPGLMNVDPNNLALDQLAYEPLIRKAPDGTFGPALATRFGYVGTGNTAFSMTLRSGVRFADGTPLDAAAVAKSINYEIKAGGPAVGWLGGCTKVTPVGALRVDVACSAPNPVLPLLFSQNAPFGLVISPAGVGTPESLKNATAGAGPYTLDATESVTGDHYVFVANKNYWNPKAVHFSRVTLKVITNPDSVLNAIRSGQADVAVGDPSTADAAKSAGLRVVAAPSYTVGVDLFDRAGVDAKPLSDARVRQALNYAVDRTAITKALFGAYGSPTTQLVTPAYDGYSAALNRQYPYDPARARQLLAAAGYPNGFSLQLEAWEGFNVAKVTQAIAGYWAKIGVHTQLTQDAAPAAWVNNVLTKKFPAGGFGYGGLPVYMTAQNWFQPTAGPFNPFLSQNPTLTGLLRQAAAATPQQSAALGLQAMTFALDQGWWVSASLVDAAYYAHPGITGISVTARNIYADMSTVAQP